jgi:redox-sensing transcriptional repressor
MIFDNDPQRIGKKIENFTVQNMADLVPLIQGANIKIAMLTVPARAAQSVTDDLIKAGIKAILNYAPITLCVPDDVKVEYVDPIIYLQQMTYYIES